MANWSMRRFSSPEILRSIAPEHLRAFLEPYRKFFDSRGVVMPARGSKSEPSYAALVELFLSPDAGTPKELIDALYFVDEMATPAMMDQLLDEAERRGLPIEFATGPSPADVAVQVWLLDRDLIERKHAESHMERTRRFEYFQYDDRARSRPKHRKPDEPRLAELAAQLDDYFEKKKRGRGVRVILSEKDDGLWFLVRHGDPLKREESLDGIEASSVYYRPLRYDVVVYAPQIGELKMRAKNVGEKTIYQKVFGQLLFDQDDAFAGADKCTLAPLREHGIDALACSGIEGLREIRLREVQFYMEGEPWEILIRKSEDFYKLLENREEPFPEDGRLLRASFRVRFGDSTKERTVVIKPSNIAHYARDGDSVLIEQWLQHRGFTKPNGANVRERAVPVLAGA